MKRHVERKHQAEDSAPIETQKRDEGNQKAAEPTEETRKIKKNKKVLNISELLISLDLAQYVEVLEKESIDLKMLLDLRPEELM